MATPIHGTVAPGFEPVLDAFRENFDQRGELGGAFAVWQGEELVVDLWGGVADPSTDRPWTPETLVPVFSVTKGLVAAAFLHLVDKGRLDLEAPVAQNWPAFAKAGKADITVRQLLEHRAGLCAVDTPLTIEEIHGDPDKTEAALVDQAPLWAPGTHQGYGATVWGLYTASLFRHITGETVGTYLRREITEPLGVDVYLGTPREELARCATVVPVSNGEIATTIVPKVVGTLLPGLLHRDDLEGRMYGAVLMDKTSMQRRALANPAMGPKRLGRINDADMLTVEFPWMNLTATAKGLATVYAALANKGQHRGTKIWRKAAIDAVKPVSSWTNHDLVLGKPLGYTQGFQKEELHLFSPHQDSFGHTGAGGSFAWCDPSRGLGFSYVCNRMDHHLRSPRATALARAMYRCVDGYR